MEHQAQTVFLVRQVQRDSKDPPEHLDCQVQLVLWDPLVQLELPVSMASPDRQVLLDDPEAVE